MEVDQTELEEEEAAETANKVEEQPHERAGSKRDRDVDDEMQQFMDYCLRLEETNQWLEWNRFQYR